MAKSLRTEAHKALIQELKRARNAAGLSQQQVADMLGVRQSYVAKVELGERRIDVIELLQLIEALDASWIDIIELVDAAKLGDRQA